jgi:ubiquinone/menaquinone biosynthesis C-methylase UbiE
LYKAWREKLWDRVRGPEVLEIGIGTGKNIPYYPPAVKVTGIDLSSGMLKHARKQLKEDGNDQVTIELMNAQRMKFPDDAFDETLATFVFCSVPDPVAGLEEAIRVTKPAGKLYLLEHMRAKNTTLATLMKILDAPLHFLSGVHIARKTVDNVEAAGWEIIKVEELNFNGIFRMIEARKPQS